MSHKYVEDVYRGRIYATDFTAIVFSPIDGFLTARQIKQTDIGILNMYISLTISPPHINLCDKNSKEQSIKENNVKQSVECL